MTAFALTPGLWLVVDALAVFSLTILVTRDVITEKPRQWIKRRLGLHAFDFITCPWCTSVWIAAAVVALTVFVPSEWKYVAYLLTCTAVAGFLAERS